MSIFLCEFFYLLGKKLLYCFEQKSKQEKVFFFMKFVNLSCLIIILSDDTSTLKITNKFIN